MRKLTQLYIDEIAFKDDLINNQIDLKSKCLVKIFTSIPDEKFALDIAKNITTILPNCKIIGSYSDQSIIYCGKDISGGTLVIVEDYEHLEIISKKFSWENKTPKELAGEIYNEFAPTDTNKNEVVNILFSNLYYDISDFVDEINKITPTIKLAGGVISTQSNDFSKTFLFNEDCSIKNGVLVFVARGEKGKYFVNASTSQEPISSIYQLTKVTDNIIEEIENTPALEWLYNYLEVKNDYNISLEEWKSRANDEYLIHFPLMREDAGGACRYTKYEQETDNLTTYFSKLNTGDKFKLSYVNPQKTIRESYELCSKLTNHPVESLFVYVCTFRKLFLSNSLKLDLAPFLEFDICGIYMLGEILYINGQNNYYNGCCSIISLADEEKYITPNVSIIQKNIESVKYDGFFFTDEFKKRQSANKSHFIEKLEASHKKQDDENIIDSNLGIFNGLKYRIDRIQYGYDKICMIEIQTADATISFVGEDEYYSICKKFIKFVENTFIETKHTNIRLYTINYKTFALSSNNIVKDKEFVAISKRLSDAFESTKFENNNDFSEVARFVVLLKQEEPLSAGLNMLFANKDSQENFLVYNNKIEINNTSADELKMIEIIKRAIANNKVIPFYQGLHNNKTGKLDKYESLMRLEDETGRIYTPYFFLDIAKKYKFYAKISRMLIEKVLNDFSERTEDISINISLYDIESPSFREWLLDELNAFPDQTRVVFEIVETEDCKELDVLYQFIDNIRATGAKVAIDDFGSGYSTFATVVDIEPNFLKIDGSIICKITENKKSLIILDTIKYLASKMNIETIGEFVETKEIQDILLEYEITYSQGYYFAKPLPFNELNDCI